MKTILIEILAKNEIEIKNFILELNNLKLLEVDLTYKPVPIIRRKGKVDFSENTFVIRGIIDENNIEELEKLYFVYKIWNDSKIDHFLCKCNSSRKGTLDDVAECIGAKQLWSKGYKGDGIVVGIVDGGIDSNVISNVINGSNSDWGTNVQWSGHGNMTSTDAKGIAPNIKLYDLRIADATSAAVSNALLAYDWASSQFDIDGTPQILSNSWGIYQEVWDTDYATNPNHPFTLKVEELLDKGIKIVFAAGNCGETCPDGIKLGHVDSYGQLNGRCNKDTGSGKDIWGANGHEEVMTVGAVKLNNHRLKYSSQGPAALFDKKPDFCTYSSFKGYYWNVNSRPDGGTSAACPVVAGCIAILLNYNNSLTQLQIKTALQNSAKDIEGFGFDYNTGFGVVRLDNAFYEFEPQQKPKQDFRDKLCDYVYNTERKCIQWEENRYQECTQTRDDGYNSCSNWAKNCCTWWPCSRACKLFSWICVAWYWISNIVCVAWTWISNIVCIAWTWFVTRVCKLYLWIITGITFTNCKCR